MAQILAQVMVHFKGSMKIWLGNSIRLPLLPRLAIIQATLASAWARRQSQQVVRNSKRKSLTKS